MNQLYSITTEHKKGQHLLFEDRVFIQTRLKNGWKANCITKEIGCAPNTVRNEISQGTVSLYNGTVHRYKAKTGQHTYESNRQNCCRHKEIETRGEFGYWECDVVIGSKAGGDAALLTLSERKSCESWMIQYLIIVQKLS